LKKIKDKLKEADTRIEQGIEKVLGISKPPRGQLEMFFVYSYLRFKENVINKIFFGSWILFSVLAFVITISSIEITTKIKKKKKRKRKRKRRTNTIIVLRDTTGLFSGYFNFRLPFKETKLKRPLTKVF